MPLQGRLAELDRAGSKFLPPLERVFNATSRDIEVPAAMEAFASQILDTESETGLWQRYRISFLGHSAAWNGPLTDCGVIEPQAGDLNGG